MNTSVSDPSSTEADGFTGARGIPPALLLRRVPFRGSDALPAPDRDAITSSGQEVESER